MPDIYYIPSGPANLANMFGAIDFNQVEEYYIEVLGGGTIATSPHALVLGCNEDVTISYVNYLGGVDSITLSVTIEHDAKSSSYQRPISNPLIKSQHGITRNNIKSNNLYTGRNTLSEEQINQLDELYDSPAAWLQQAATQGMSADYIPVVITDKKAVKRKEDNRFAYDVELEFSLSHERIVIQN